MILRAEMKRIAEMPLQRNMVLITVVKDNQLILQPLH